MTANIEDFTTFEVETPDRLTVKVNASVDFKGLADKVSEELDEQLAHEIATRYGYVKERTCRNLAADEDTFCCSECRNETHGYMFDDFGCTVGFGIAVARCPNCGARVQRLVEQG